MSVALRARRPIRWPASTLALVTGVVVMLAAMAGGISLRAALPAPATAATPHVAAPSISFAPNRGQAPPGSDVVGDSGGVHVALSSTGATTSAGGHSVAMQLSGARADAALTESGALPGRVNYLIGPDSSRWLTGIPTYSSVGYRGVYLGIDVAYDGAQGQLEYDFTIAPGADPAQIAMTFTGVTSIATNRAGDLVLDTTAGVVVHHRPRIFQHIGAGVAAVAGGFVLHGGNEVGFSVGTYDRALPLIIDPTIVYSTYLGGSGSEEGGYDIAADAAGNAYVAGGTANPGAGGGSVDFPTTAGAFQTTPGGGVSDANGDAYVTKLAPDGKTLIWSTYIGGSGFDDSGGIAVDRAGHVFVRGVTNSPDFPTTPGAFQTQQAGPSFNVWVAELAADGSSLVYSTYLGGHGFNSGTGLAIDGSGAAYVTGLTGAPDFPTTPDAFDTNFHGKANFAPPPFSSRPDDYDAFVAKLSPDGSHLEYSTYLGGNRLDAGFGVAVDGHGNAFVAGDTRSPSFPATVGAFDKTFNGQTDAFVAEVNPTGTGLVYATFLGGSGFDEGISVAVDLDGHAYVTGSTASADFPTTPGAFQTQFASTLAPPPQPCTPIAPPPCGPRNAYVTELSRDGSTLLYSTYIGGSVFDFGQSIVVDSSGRAYIGGGTFSPDYPTTSGAPQATLGGSQDAIVSVLSPDGSSLVMSTFLGGADFDQGVGVAVPSAGSIFVTGATSSTDFPVTPGAFQASLHGASNGFVTRIQLGP